MKTLNEITQRLDGTTFNTWKVRDFDLSEMIKEEIEGLKERLEILENTEDLDVAADGFGDNYEEFEGMDLFDERSILRSILRSIIGE